MYRILFGLFLNLLLFSYGSASACTYGNYRWYFGQQTNAFMEADSGKPCSMGKGFWTDGRSTMMSVAVLTKPNNGTTNVQGQQIFYRSKPGFRGQDTFVFGITGKGSKNTGTAKVLVTVSVK